MSSSATSSRRSWPQYGEVPMTRCPDWPRTALLKRRVTTSDKNRNLGREYVKCDGKPEAGKLLPKCGHFEWLDEYIARIQMEVAPQELEMPSVMEQFGVRSGSGNLISAATVGDAYVRAELKKMSKQLKEIIALKK